MSTRISEWTIGAGLISLALTACDGTGGAQNAPAQASSGTADCAIGSSDWSRSCAVERDGDLLTIRHSDGGFRRFRIVKDGRGLIAGDGAEQANVAVIDKGQIEVSAGEDRYRLPASIDVGPAS